MKKSITVSNLTLSLYLDYVRPAAIKAGLLEDAVTEDGKPYHVTDEAVAKEIESDMRCACFNANNDSIERAHDEYIANEAEQMLCQIDVSLKYCKDSKVIEALQALRDAMTAELESRKAAEIVRQVSEKIEQTKTRSAWSKGVKEYATELCEELGEAVRDGWVDADDLSNRRLFEKAMLNGAQDWRQYSEGGCSLVWDYDIANRLCNATELKRTAYGAKEPNSRENWIDVQSRALFQAAQMVLNAAF